MTRYVLWFVLTAGGLAFFARPAMSTTMLPQSLEQLAANNPLVVHARVLELHSYWHDQTIITDVQLQPFQVLQGSAELPALMRISLLGGTVGEITVLPIGGPELHPGRDYILFLKEGLLPNGIQLTVPDLVQGVFDLEGLPVHLRAISQFARYVGDEAPGGQAGFPLAELIERLRRPSPTTDG